MKVAVLGSGPLALEVSLDLQSVGASVKLIGKNLPGGHLLYLSEKLPELELDFNCISTTLGRQVAGSSLEGPTSVENIFNEYYAPIIKKLQQDNIVQNREVLRVQKQFLELDETIEKRSRLFDLFRVTTGLNPSGMVEEQLQQNPELRERIGEDILASLKNRVESFEDFDLVIDARGDFQRSLALGAGGHYALNEQALSGHGPLHYGLLQNEQIAEIDSLKNVSIVGSGYTAAVNLCLLEQWLNADDSRVINIVTTEEVAFRKLLKADNTPTLIKEGVKRIIKKQMNDWRTECERVEKEILHWRGLEGHERMKASPPEFPSPKISLYEGYTVTSVDRLLDQESTFITLEIPSWRNLKEAKDLITLSQDFIIGSRGFAKKDDVIGPMQDDEPGFFELSGAGNLSSGLEKIKLIKSAIFDYFSRADGA